ncbi:hemophore-related protein [Mycobacterium sp. DL592]|uniref:hemophore-related protein n=1 Tax=Mycobacterium sp. DL592 TaxID=2675524 RepID=UPI001FBBF7C6|nr:hemophore-related protein [Mycobacterium sp. DL592]
MKFAEGAATRRMVGIGLSALVGGMALAVVAAPAAFAAPDCSKAGVDNTVATVQGQAQSYMNSHPDGQKVLMSAALQPRPQAEQTLRNYAAANPQEYADFKAILAPLGTLQDQCGVQVVPPQFQWAFDAFVG